MMMRIQHTSLQPEAELLHENRNMIIQKYEAQIQSCERQNTKIGYYSGY